MATKITNKRIRLIAAKRYYEDESVRIDFMVLEKIGLKPGNLIVLKGKILNEKTNREEVQKKLT